MSWYKATLHKLCKYLHIYIYIYIWYVHSVWLWLCVSLSTGNTHALDTNKSIGGRNLFVFSASYCVVVNTSIGWSINTAVRTLPFLISLACLQCKPRCNKKYIITHQKLPKHSYLSGDVNRSPSVFQYLKQKYAPKRKIRRLVPYSSKHAWM